MASLSTSMVLGRADIEQKCCKMEEKAKVVQSTASDGFPQHQHGPWQGRHRTEVLQDGGEGKGGPKHCIRWLPSAPAWSLAGQTSNRSVARWRRRQRWSKALHQMASLSTSMVLGRADIEQKCCKMEEKAKA